ncbi:flagellar filament capping protein FliD [Terrabacter aerolatus]|uniref:Flagellar hook-associated protein 2 n=1 Tax=Terrabacter aerolatus TaxID=422442 RepID=A0A512CVW5_9MICO|nr:flagellar filament capping protein FliD [Terrabacter aerolatus]GEO28337.1 flagellar hook-associated protein 2 [Terrabacter aerolatus]
MAVSVNGLGSGLDITSIVNSIMAVEALPQQQLKQAQSQQESLMTVLRGLNTKAAALATLAGKAAAPNALNLLTATSSTPGVTATAGTSATAGTFDVTVTQLARTQVDVSAPLATWPTAGGSPASLTLVDASGASSEVTPASTSIDDVVAAVNASGGPARALKVAAGTDATGTPLYRLQLTSTRSGAAGAFSAYQGSAAEVAAGTAADLMGTPGAAVVAPAQDAKALLYAGTAAEQVVTSATSTFTDIVPGVSVTATAAGLGTATSISVTGDSAGITKQANDLVASVNDLLGAIGAGTKVTTTSGSSGVSGATGGPLTGDVTVRGISAAITDAAYRPTSNGRSPSQIGIVIQRDGTFTFDQDAFNAALTADPAGTRAALAEIAGRVTTAATNASAPASGTITQLIAGRQSMSDDLGTRIATWDQRLADRRTAVLAMYNAMDTALGSLKTQQSWLTSQIAGLPTFSQNTK